MFVRVDEGDKSVIEGFAYENNDGNLEYVYVDDDSSVKIEDATGAIVLIYDRDIPKLIKALQAAYDHIQKGK